MATQTSNNVNSSRFRDIFSETTSLLSEDVDTFKKYAAYYLKGPVGKWTERRRLPIKMIVQLAKVIIITLQIYNYGQSQLPSMSTLVLDRVFIRDCYNNPFLCDNYTPFVVSLPQMLDNLNFTINTYMRLANESLNSFHVVKVTPNQLFPVSLCRNVYDIKIKQHISDFQAKINHSVESKLECDNITLLVNSTTYNISEIDKFSNNDIFQNVFQIDLKMRLMVLTVITQNDHNVIFGEYIDYTIEMSSLELNGMYKMSSLASRISDLHPVYKNNENFTLIVSYLVLIVCFISLITCTRSIVKSIVLARMTNYHFMRIRGERLSFCELLVYFDVWNLVIILTDISNIVVTIIFLPRIHAYFNSSLGIAYGINILFIWTGLLRYLKFFSGFNILMMTLSRSVLTVVRFMSCTIIVYTGFVFCGWIALHPYNERFETLYGTAKTLFAIMNGDEIIATMALTGDKFVRVFSDFYQIVFVSFFIYVVLSLFTSIFVQFYETSSERSFISPTVDRVSVFLESNADNFD